MPGCMRHVRAPGRIYADFSVLEQERRVVQVDARDAKQLTPLHVAAAGGHAGAMRRLLGLGAEVDPCDSRGRTPLHHAAKQGRVAAAEALVRTRSGTSVKPKSASSVR